MNLKNRTNKAIEMIAIHHGLNTIGNKIISSHAHQGGRDHPLSAGLADPSSSLFMATERLSPN
jgi:hypothetical protein